jgi:hypothetical protein
MDVVLSLSSRSVSSILEEDMKRRALQIFLALSGLLMVFRFGIPALMFGATGPGPFANRWLGPEANATLLLDADLRFFGAMMLGIGLIFFWAIVRLETLGSVIYVLASAVAVGAAARIYARVTYGNPGPAGTIPVVLEVVIPTVLILLRYSIGKDLKSKRT